MLSLKLSVQMQVLKEKQKQIEELKNTRIKEIQQLIAAFSTTIQAETPQVS
jgi:hypothetical protein